MPFPLQCVLHYSVLTPVTVGPQLLEHTGSSASMAGVDKAILLLSFGDAGFIHPMSLF